MCQLQRWKYTYLLDIWQSINLVCYFCIHFCVKKCLYGPLNMQSLLQRLFSYIISSVWQCSIFHLWETTCLGDHCNIKSTLCACAKPYWTNIGLQCSQKTWSKHKNPEPGTFYVIFVFYSITVTQNTKIIQKSKARNFPCWYFRILTMAVTQNTKVTRQMAGCMLVALSGDQSGASRYTNGL